ncbi:MAG: DMT family transporter [Prevotella sp.]|jgi:drug/metabolite transporter (DMT)-like permease|nr:DMT family transporter [Prevotella sp.]MCI2080038.1 DMT family transporter [Prevotella sp.]MCI2101849.1 DMT family transporter [Prevotella sp.]
MMKDNQRPLRAHLSMFTAELFWGLMSPLGKDAMTHGIDGIDMVSFRVLGAALLFWTASLFTTKVHVPKRDIMFFAGAAVLGIVTNQCLFTIGLSITSPINASIVTTSMPIFAMILSFFILKEPVTWKKAGGVLIGCMGAVILILTSASAANAKVGNIWGDMMCLLAQLSFALYLALFNPLIRRYDVITVNKWMFLWASILIIPFSSGHVMQIGWANVPVRTWMETGYVIIFGTFLSYLLSIVGQRTLRPTVVSVYNNVQPIVAVTISVLTGISIFTFPQGLAIILVFAGVWLVTKSKSKRDMEKLIK